MPVIAGDNKLLLGSDVRLLSSSRQASIDIALYIECIDHTPSVSINVDSLYSYILCAKEKIKSDLLS